MWHPSPRHSRRACSDCWPPPVAFVLSFSFNSCLCSGEELSPATSACANTTWFSCPEDLLLTFVSPLDLLAHGWPVVGDNGVICQTMPDTHYRPTFKAVREVLHSLRSKTNTTSVVGTWSSSASCFGS